MNHEVVIVGYGTAAVNALIALRSAGYAGTVKVISNTDTLPYSPILTSHYAGGEFDRAGLFPWTQTELDRLAPELMSSCEVTGMDPAAHVLHTSKGDIPYSKCLIATGSTPARAGFPQIEGYEPLVLRTVSDAERLRSALEDPGCGRILISGTSMVALKALEACLDQNVQATLLGRSEHILKRIAVPQIAQEYEQALSAAGVDLKLGTTVAAAKLVDGQVEVTFSTGETLAYSQALVAHGMMPNIGFAREGGIACDQGILVDEHLRTSDPDVYAAGDVAQALDLATGERRIVALWKCACEQGACAGRAIAAELAGQKPEAVPAFEGFMPTNSISVQGTTLVSGGFIGCSAEYCVELGHCEDVSTALVYEGDELVGFNAFSAQGAPGSDVFQVGMMLLKRLRA